MLDSLRRSTDKLAEATLRVLEIESPIEDINAVIQSLGGQIEEDDTMSELSDGYIIKAPEGTPHLFEIHIPKTQSERRKNFTIAHEIGHLIIDMGFLNSEEWNKASGPYHRSGDTLSERIADEFGAAFLMPTSEYQKQVQKNTSADGRVDIQAIADYFHVSRDAAQNRGRWLGILSW